MRQIAPISPALHLGADRILVIGVRSQNDPEFVRQKTRDYPSMAQIGGHVLNSIFLDSMDADLERLKRINRTLELIPKKLIEDGTIKLKPVKVLEINPSRDISKIAQQHAQRLPSAVRFFMRGIGGLSSNSTSLLSYLLCDKAYCRDLIALGYADTINRREEVMEFLDVKR
jgi:NTE family protein